MLSVVGDVGDDDAVGGDDVGKNEGAKEDNGQRINEE